VPDTVGQVPFGGRAEAHAAVGRAKQPQVIVARMGCVHCGESTGQRPVALQHRSRGRPIGTVGLLVLRRLLRHVGVQNRVVRIGPCCHGANVARTDRSNGMDRGADPCVASDARTKRVGSFSPSRDRPIAKSSLLVPDRPGLPPVIDTAAEITRVQQRDAKASVRCGGENGLAHCVGVGVERAIRLVVEVVELANAGHPGQHHLGERRSRQPMVRVGGQGASKSIHLVAPRPERTDSLMGTPPQRPVKRMAVGIREAGNRHPWKPH
jgi:hypothetical protein